jgi:hypothetical protein
MLDRVRRAIKGYFFPAQDACSGEADSFEDDSELDVSGVSDDGRVISLRITFRAGERYCCVSPACGFPRAFFGTEWVRLRQLLRREGVEPAGPIRFVVRVVCEAGALFADRPGEADTSYSPVENAYWNEYETDEDHPRRTQRVVRSSESEG